MIKFLVFLKKIGVSALITIVGNLLSVIDRVFCYLEKKEIKKENKKIDKDNSDLKDICDKGSMDDLINFTKKVLLILIIPISMISGCKSEQI